MDTLFFVPNLDKNVRLEEAPDGVIISYTLFCDKDFPYKTGITNKNKAYCRTKTLVKYQNNMSDALAQEYYKMKNSMMYRINEFKINKLIDKRHQLNEIGKQLKLVL